MTGHFKPGERMVETSLCEQLGVSRTSLRETLRMLAAEKLIVMTPNRGPSVAIISWEEAAQIYHVRAILEGEMAALAAKRVKDAGIEEMHAELKHFEDAVAASDTLTRLSATTDFYEVIIRCSGNHIIGDLIHGLHARINFLRARTMASPGRPRHSVREMTCTKRSRRVMCAPPGLPPLHTYRQHAGSLVHVPVFGVRFLFPDVGERDKIAPGKAALKR